MKASIRAKLDERKDAPVVETVTVPESSLTYINSKIEVRLRRLGYENYFTDPTVSAEIFERDAKQDEEVLVKKLLKEFNAKERVSFLSVRPRGTTTAEHALYTLRRIAVERYFMRHSHHAAQTKRHMYYKCKNLFCGIDNGQTDGYFATTIANIIGDACWAGRISFTRVRDDTRRLTVPDGNKDARECLEDAVNGFMINLSRTQPTRVIVCTEKDAVIESISTQCWGAFVPYQSFHGQNSDGGAYKVAELIDSWKNQGCKHVVVASMTDFDNGGIIIQDTVFSPELDADGEPRGRLLKALKKFFPGAPSVEVERLAITEDDLNNPEYKQHIIDMDLLTEDGTVSRKKIAQVRDFINSRNPWFAQFTKGEVKNMPEEELLALVGRMDLRTLGVDVLSTEEINERVAEFIAKHRADGVKQWEEQEVVQITEKEKLEDTLKVFDENALHGTLSTCKNCGKEIIYSFQYNDDADNHRNVYDWQHTDSSMSCDADLCEGEFAEPVGKAEETDEGSEEETDEGSEEEKLETSYCENCGEYIYVTGGEWRHCFGSKEEGYTHSPDCKGERGTVAEPREEEAND